MRGKTSVFRYRRGGGEFPSDRGDRHHHLSHSPGPVLQSPAPALQPYLHCSSCPPYVSTGVSSRGNTHDGSPGPVLQSPASALQPYLHCSSCPSYVSTGVSCRGNTHDGSACSVLQS